MLQSKILLCRCLRNFSINKFGHKALNRSNKNLLVALPITYLNRRYFSENKDSSPINLEIITKGDKDLEHKLKVLMLEMELMRQEGKLVPENHLMKTDHWTELLNRTSRAGRRKYLEFLFKNIKRKEHQLQKKLEKQSIPIIKKVKDLPFEEFVLSRDLQHNNFFLRIYDTTINQLYNNKLIQAMQFGQKLVVDCGYDDKMTARENINCAKQLTLAFAENRVHEDPYDLHFCNCNFNSTLFKSLHKNIGTLYDSCFPLNLHESSYLDNFPKEKLIYLTPHCRDEMTEFDHDAVYIIGAIVDKVNQEPLSLAKAKQENIKMLKFPLDKYLLWGSGPGKSLTLNQVISILLDIKSTGDWNHALRHVPRRKLVDMSKMSEEKTSFTRNRTQIKNLRPVANYSGLTYNKNSKYTTKSNKNKSSNRRLIINSLYED